MRKGYYLAYAIVLLIIGIAFNFWLSDFVHGFYDISEWGGSFLTVPTTYCLLSYFAPLAPRKVFFISIVTALVSVLLLTTSHLYDVQKALSVIGSAMVVWGIEYKRIFPRIN